MFQKWNISALHDSLHNEVLKKGYNAKFSMIKQLYETAQMVKEASCYNCWMWCINSANTAADILKFTTPRPQVLSSQ